jgi:hypothetical protein
MPESEFELEELEHPEHSTMIISKIQACIFILPPSSLSHFKQFTAG